MLDADTLTVWNLVDPSVKPQTYEANAIGATLVTLGASLNWVGEDRLVLTNSVTILSWSAFPTKCRSGVTSST